MQIVRYAIPFETARVHSVWRPAITVRAGPVQRDCHPVRLFVHSAPLEWRMRPGRSWGRYERRSIWRLPPEGRISRLLFPSMPDSQLVEAPCDIFAYGLLGPMMLPDMHAGQYAELTIAGTGTFAAMLIVELSS